MTLRLRRRPAPDDSDRAEARVRALSGRPAAVRDPVADPPPGGWVPDDDWLQEAGRLPSGDVPSNAPVPAAPNLFPTAPNPTATAPNPLPTAPNPTAAAPNPDAPATTAPASATRVPPAPSPPPRPAFPAGPGLPEPDLLPVDPSFVPTAAAVSSPVSPAMGIDSPLVPGSAGNPSVVAGPGWGPLRGALADRLPAALVGAAVAPSRRAVAGLAVVALAVVATTGWLLLHNSPQPTAVGAVPRTLPSSTASAVPAKVVLVDVAGKVRRPGVVRLPLGSRVADALRAAGGVRPGVDIGLLNLARPLTDGEQVIVGMAGPAGPPLAGTGQPGPGAGPSGTGSAAGNPVNLNLATATDLDGLPGVGPVLAQRIVDWRTAHGPFTSVDQLREVSGIGDRRFQDLKELVRV